MFFSSVGLKLPSQRRTKDKQSCTGKEDWIGKYFFPNGWRLSAFKTLGIKEMNTTSHSLQLDSNNTTSLSVVVLCFITIIVLFFISYWRSHSFAFEQKFN